MELALLLLLSLFLLTSRAQSQLPPLGPVLDTEGNPVVEGAQYRVLPANAPNGGALKMAPVNGSCPPNIIQQQGIGQPVMFFQDGVGAGGAIIQGEGLYILFPRPSPCPQSTLWTVGREGYITTGGAAIPSKPTSSRFYIGQTGDGACRIRLFCAECLPFCYIACPGVGLREVDGRMLLSLASDSDVFVFERVKEPTINRLGTMHPEV